MKQSASVCRFFISWATGSNTYKTKTTELETMIEVKADDSSICKQKPRVLQQFCQYRVSFEYHVIIT